MPPRKINPQKQTTFVQVAVGVAKLRMSGTKKNILGWLVTNADQDARVRHWTVSRIGKMFGLAPKTVREHLAWLEKHGYLKRTPVEGSASEYELLFHEWMQDPSTHRSDRVDDATGTISVDAIDENDNHAPLTIPIKRPPARVVVKRGQRTSGSVTGGAVAPLPPPASTPGLHELVRELESGGREIGAADVPTLHHLIDDFAATAQTPTWEILAKHCARAKPSSGESEVAFYAALLVVLYRLAYAHVFRRSRTLVGPHPVIGDEPQYVGDDAASVERWQRYREKYPQRSHDELLLLFYFTFVKYCRCGGANAKRKDYPFRYAPHSWARTYEQYFDDHPVVRRS